MLTLNPKTAFPGRKLRHVRPWKSTIPWREAHASLSFSLIWFDWDWIGAEKEAKRAIALNPNSAHGHFAYAHVLTDLGRHKEAIAEIARARESDPVFLLHRALEGMFLHQPGRDAEAGAKLQKAIEIDPNFWVTRLMVRK